MPPINPLGQRHDLAGDDFRKQVIDLFRGFFPSPSAGRRNKPAAPQIQPVLSCPRSSFSNRNWPSQLGSSFAALPGPHISGMPQQDQGRFPLPGMIIPLRMFFQAEIAQGRQPLANHFKWLLSYAHFRLGALQALGDGLPVLLLAVAADDHNAIESPLAQAAADILDQPGQRFKAQGDIAGKVNVPATA